MVKKKDDLTAAFQETVKTAPALPNDEELSRISALAQRQVALENQVEVEEAQLAETNQKLEEVRGKLLPELLMGHGLLELKLATGEKIQVDKFFAASITKERAEECLTWLDKHGFGGLVKYGLKADAGKGEVKLLATAVAALKKLGLKAETLKGVHPQTLKAFVNEQLAKGTDLPLDLFSVFPVVKTKITGKKEPI
jgi:hypothetical protein